VELGHHIYAGINARPTIFALPCWIYVYMRYVFICIHALRFYVCMHALRFWCVYMAITHL